MFGSTLGRQQLGPAASSSAQVSSRRYCGGETIWIRTPLWLVSPKCPRQASRLICLPAMGGQREACVRLVPSQG